MPGAYQTPQCVAHEDLPGVGLRREPCGDVHRAADKLLVVRDDLTRVNTDADVKRAVRVLAVPCLCLAQDRDSAVERREG